MEHSRQVLKKEINMEEECWEFLRRILEFFLLTGSRKLTYEFSFGFNKAKF